MIEDVILAGNHLSIFFPTVVFVRGARLLQLDLRKENELWGNSRETRLANHLLPANDGEEFRGCTDSVRHPRVPVPPRNYGGEPFCEGAQETH